MGEQTKSEELNGSCVWVLAASPVWRAGTQLDRLPQPDAVIAADGGSALAARLGLIPSLVIGDLDSADPTLLQSLQAQGTEFSRYEHSVKLETDTELAALAALRWQPAVIVLLGAVGGRLDHFLANVLMLTHPLLAPVDVRLVDGPEEIYLAKPGRWNPVRGEAGDTVTLLPIGADVEGVSARGLHWPLAEDTLPVGRGRGVSNLIEEPPAGVRYERGQLLVVAIHRQR